MKHTSYTAYRNRHNLQAQPTPTHFPSSQLKHFNPNNYMYAYPNTSQSINPDDSYSR